MTGRQRRVRAGWTLFALDGLAVITSFLPGAPFGSITLATVVGAALLLAAVLTAWTGFAGELKHGLQKRPPGPVVFAGALAFLVMTGSIVTLGGQPEVDNGGYFLNDHGVLHPLDASGYDAALAKEGRIFLGLSALLAVAVVAADVDDLDDDHWEGDR